eukprot:2844620-Prymnesium_polylepis.1
MASPADAVVASHKPPRRPTDPQHGTCRAGLTAYSPPLRHQFGPKTRDEYAEYIQVAFCKILKLSRARAPRSAVGLSPGY